MNVQDTLNISGEHEATLVKAWEQAEWQFHYAFRTELISVMTYIRVMGHDRALWPKVKMWRFNAGSRIVSFAVSRLPWHRPYSESDCFEIEFSWDDDSGFTVVVSGGVNEKITFVSPRLDTSEMDSLLKLLLD